MKFLSRLSRNLFKLSRVFSSSSFFRAREVVMQSRRIGETQLGIDHLLRSTIISRIKGTRVRGSECRTSVRQVDYPESRSARRSRLFIVARFKFAGSIYFFFSLSFLPFFLFLLTYLLTPLITNNNHTDQCQRKAILKLSFSRILSDYLFILQLFNVLRYCNDRKYCTRIFLNSIITKSLESLLLLGWGERKEKGHACFPTREAFRIKE